MRTFVNFRFLAALIAVVAIVGGAVHGLHVLLVRHQVRFLLEQAHRASEEKDYHLAVTRFQQYTSLVPGDTEALADFGLLLADLGQAKGASGVLEKVLRSQPDRQDVRRRLVQVDMGLGRFSAAKEHLQQYLLTTSPNDSLLWEQLGICLEWGGEYQPAVDAFANAIKFDPKRLEAYIGRARVLRGRLEPPKEQEADQWVEKMVATNPKSARAQVLAASHLNSASQKKQLLGHPQEALEYAKRASEHAQQALKLAPTTWTPACWRHNWRWTRESTTRPVAMPSGPSS